MNLLTFYLFRDFRALLEPTIILTDSNVFSTSTVNKLFQDYSHTISKDKLTIIRKHCRAISRKQGSKPDISCSYEKNRGKNIFLLHSVTVKGKIIHLEELLNTKILYYIEPTNFFRGTANVEKIKTSNS